MMYLMMGEGEPISWQTLLVAARPQSDPKDRNVHVPNVLVPNVPVPNVHVPNVHVPNVHWPNVQHVPTCSNMFQHVPVPNGQVTFMGGGLRPPHPPSKASPGGATPPRTPPLAHPRQVYAT